MGALQCGCADGRCTARPTLPRRTCPPPRLSSFLPPAACPPVSTSACGCLLRADEKHGNGADTYLHRVGRAGRFGTKGLAITFVASPADSEVLNQVGNGGGR